MPIDELPPQDQLPAAPLLVAAYAFVVLALFAYVVSLARRLGGVQRDVERLESRSEADPGAPDADGRATSSTSRVCCCSGS